MNVVGIFGGLGNQMFQYVFGRALERRSGDETYYDLTYFTERRRRKNGLAEFACEVKSLDPKTVRALCRDSWWMRLLGKKPRLRHVLEDASQGAQPELFAHRNAYFEGYFQVAAYYEEMRDEILGLFTLRQEPESYKALVREVESCESCSVHVRRGDYVTLGVDLASNDPTYYARAVNLAKERLKDPVFYVISDDIAWAKENVKIEGNVRYVPPVDLEHPVYDMMLMSRCRHNIAANSSFSWWGAWLNRNPEKLVVVPRRWSRDVEQPQMIPAGWERV